MKKLLSVLLAVVLVVSLCACSAPAPKETEAAKPAATETKAAEENAAPAESAAPQQKYEYSVGASATSGTTYRWVVPMTELVNKYSDFVTLTPITTTGSVENVNLVISGDAPIGAGPVSTINQAISGLSDWEGNPVDPSTFKFIMSYMPDFFYIAVPADSDINTLADMVGKTIAFGEIGTGTYTGTLAALKAMGYTEDDFKIENVSYADAAVGCAEGWIDAVPIYGSAMNTAIMEMSASPVGLKIVGPSQEEIDKALAASPVYVSRTLTGDISYGQENDVPTLGGTTGLFCSADIPDEVCYEIARIMNEHIDELKLSFELAEFSAIENTIGSCNIIEVSGGTQKYLTELGLQ